MLLGIFPMNGKGATRVPPGAVKNTAMQDNPVDISSDEDDDISLSLAAARSAVDQSPTSYDAHLRLVNVLRTEDVDELRIARNSFADAFPLQPDVWIDWLDDECRLASTAAERATISASLIPRALQDFVSVELAIHCVRFQGNRVSRGELDIQEYVRWFNQIATAAGCIYSSGMDVWMAFRDQLKLLDAPSDIQAQIARQQHLVPLRVAADHSADEVPSESNDDDVLPLVLEAFEKKLKDAGSAPGEYSGSRNAAVESSYAAYAFSEEVRSPPAARIVWERCIAECFLHPTAWMSYAAYSERCFDRASAAAVLQRATRSVPWHLPVWIALLGQLGQIASNSTELLLAVQQVAGGAAPIVMQSSDMEGAERLSSMIVAFCGVCQADGDCDVSALLSTAVSFNVPGTSGWGVVKQLAAWVEQKRTSPVPALEEIVSSALGREARWWVDYALFLKDTGHVSEARVIFRRGLAGVASSGEAAVLGRSWLQFEIQSGAEPEAFVEAQTAVDARVHTASEYPNVVAPAVATHGRRKRAPPPLTRPRRKKVAPQVRTQASDAENDQAEKTETTADTMGDGAELPGAASKSAKPPGKDDSQETKEMFESKVIYVNNLDFGVTQEMLRTTFQQAGEVQDVRIPQRKDGVSKGFAYIEFGNDEAVEAALKFHKMKISGREAWVRRSKPPKGKPIGKTVGSTQKGDAASSAPQARASEAPMRSGLMKPRVCLNASASKSQEASTMELDNQGEDAPADEKQDKNLGQNDFRAMLLQKKT